jgi:hypothetical protein
MIANDPRSLFRMGPAGNRQLSRRELEQVAVDARAGRKVWVPDGDYLATEAGSIVNPPALPSFAGAQIPGIVATTVSAGTPTVPIWFGTPSDQTSNTGTFWGSATAAVLQGAFDTVGFWDPTAPDRLAIPPGWAGWYRVAMYFSFGDSTTPFEPNYGIAQILLNGNGLNQGGGVGTDAYTTTTGIQPLLAVYYAQDLYMNVADYIQGQITLNNNGSGTSFLGNGAVAYLGLRNIG